MFRTLSSNDVYFFLIESKAEAKRRRTKITYKTSIIPKFKKKENETLIFRKANSVSLSNTNKLIH